MNVNIDKSAGQTLGFAHLGFDEDSAERLGALASSRSFEPGAELLVPRGGLALITEGLASRESGMKQPPARVGAGELVGAEGFLLGPHPRAHLVARSPLRWLELGADPLSKLDAELRVALDAAVVRALRQTQRRGAAPVIAVVPGHHRAPVTELAAALAEALAELDTSVVVVHPRPLPDPAWQTWLDELRKSHRYVVLACEDPESLERLGSWATEWTCVAVDARRSPKTWPRAPRWLARAGRVALALIQDSAHGPYPGTARWLDRITGIDGHHHLCLEAPASVSRLARLLVGRATSLVLGAGGCRGFAHLGVYRALIEAGVEIDFVAGSSIGAVVGGLIAHNWDPDRLEHAARVMFVEGSSILDLRPSPSSLLAGERLARGFRSAYGEIEIEDLPIGFACTSTDLVSMRPRVHTRGRLWELSKASGSMPGAAPPVRAGDEVLVDGSVLDPLPLNLARVRHGGRIIAVNLIPLRPSRRFARYFERQTLGRWLVERTRVHLVDVVQRSLQARAVHEMRSQRHGDELWIDPPLEGIGVFDHHRFEELVERGYVHAKAQLASAFC